VDLRKALRGYRVGGVFLAVGLALIGIYLALPAGNPQSALYDAAGFAAAAAILTGVRMYRPSAPVAWILFAIGNVCLAVGDLLSTVLDDPPIPSAADWVYLAAYPLVAAGLVMLLIRAGGHHRRAAIGEALIFILAFWLVQWTFIIQPIVDGQGTATERAVAAAYPMMDVVLFAALAGFFTTAAWRTPAFLLLVAGVVPLLVADEIYGLTADTYTPGSYLDLAWLLSYVLWGAAALHPSMRELSQARPRAQELRVSGIRVVVLTGALLAGPAVLIVQKARGAPYEIWAVAIPMVLIAILVVIRLVTILRTLEHIRLQLVEADRVKDEFVALISHDLRTPLTSIMGYSELALDDDLVPPLDAERRGYLEVVSRSSHRLLRLVDDLLFVARLQSGRLDLTATALDLREVARQAADEAQRRAEAKGIQLVFRAEGPVEIEADRGRIFQLLDNLVSNAIKFTPDGGMIEVSVTTNGAAVLEVRDTGVGFTAEEARRIFERFFRTEAAVEGQVQGTGLGLFIAHAITEAHGGTISAAPREGGGAVFTVELPRANGNHLTP
jgi:signal transduction histidine kinase